MKKLSTLFSNSLFALLLSVLSAIFTACQDHGVPTPPQHGLRLTQIRNTAGRSLINYDFYYDEQKRLTRQEDYNPGNGVAQNSVTFFYDGNNRLIRIETVYLRLEGQGKRELISYNAQGLPQTYRVFSLDNGLQRATFASSNEYFYTPQGQLTGFIRRPVNTTLRTEFQYIYTGKNITQINQAVYAEGKTEPEQTSQVQYTFDDKLNPYKGFLALNWETPHLLVNENNITGPDRTYTYNSQGLPTQIFFPSPLLPAIVNFEYAPY